jgi:hypothetical protein
MTYRAVVLVLVAAFTVPAVAAETKTQQELQMLKAHCGPDMERLCPKVQAGHGRIKACLSAHKKEISVGCAETLQKLKKK